VARYVPPAEFDALAVLARSLGFCHVARAVRAVELSCDEMVHAAAASG